MNPVTLAMARRYADTVASKPLSEIEHITSNVRRIETEKAKIHNLITGETGVSATNCTLTQDDQIYKVGTSGWRMTMDGAVTATLERTFSPPLDLHYCAIGTWIYVDDPTKIDNIVVRMRAVPSGEEAAYRLQLLVNEHGDFNVVQGWNFLRWRADRSAKMPSDFGAFDRLRVLPVTNGATFIVVGQVWAEYFNKARLLFIQDGAYSQFYDVGYPDMKARNMPVTIATIPNKIGTENRLSEEDLYALSLENGNEVSLHSWDAEDLSQMTGEQLREESYKSIRWLRERGYDWGSLWRAAWFRNDAPNALETKDMFMAFAMSGALSRESFIEAFPFTNPYNVRRVPLHALTQAQLDDYFARLEATRGVLVGYTHEIKDEPSDMSPAMWSYFLQKIDAGVSDGWLEGTTFSQLMRPYLGDGLTSVGTRR